MARTSRPHRLPSGNWRIRWQDAERRWQSATFPNCNDARAALARNEVEAEEVRVGSRPAPPPAKTFDDLSRIWLEMRAGKRSLAADKSRLRKHLEPAFGGMLLTAITFERIEKFKAERASAAKQTLRHLLVLVNSMLKYGHRLGWLLTVPPVDMPSVRAFSRDFSFLRSMDEIQRFLRAARADGDDAFTLYTMAIYTGLRQGELAALTWDRVEFDRRLITVDRSWDGPTKAEDVRYVPLVDALVPVLRAWRLRTPGIHVFPNDKATMHKKCDRIFAERFHGVLDAAGFERRTTGKQVHYIRFHDLRHTFASHWMMRGGDLFKLQRILGHKSVEMTLRYAHLSPDAFAGDLGRFSAIATGDGGDVLPMPRKVRLRSA